MKKAVLFLIILMLFTFLQLLQSKQCLCFGVAAYGQNLFNNSLKDDNLISNLKQFTTQQLLDTGDYYYNNNDFDTALACYNIIINTKTKDDSDGQHKNIVEAYNRSAALYYYMSDYRSAYDFLIKALLLCEKYDYTAYESRIYNNLGTIYTYFKKHDMSKLHYSKALNLSEDSVGMIVLLNNLGALELSSGEMSKSLDFLSRSLQISKRHDNIHLGGILNSLALYYEKIDQPDSAFYYFQLALEDAKKNNKIEYMADNLSGVGKLFLDINKKDSALYYIDLSNAIAIENNFLAILAENHLVLSKIEESKLNIEKAFDYYKIYASLKDSVFNVERFGEINQLQRLYEISKTNQQIEQLTTEQQIKEHTIHYQKIIQYITLCGLLLMSGVALFIFFQKNKLNKAYKILFEKNIRIMDLQESSSIEHSEKYQKSTLTDDMQKELLDKILVLMEDATIICNPEFSLDKLAELVHSNHAYVSQVINTVFRKNFRAFLNGYRIREVQRLFSDSETSKHTIEFISSQAGFKSSSTFRATFKEITGVSPSFYLRSTQEQRRKFLND
jgi:AraC-type DNA-binding domain-containing proteins